MPRAPFLFALTLGFTLVLSAPAVLFAAETAAISPLKHRGFTIDYSSLQRREFAAELEAAMRSQFDMVSSVGVPPATLDFFRQIPIKFVEHFTGSPAGYDAGKVEVSIAIIAFSERPVLLHEYLHAFVGRTGKIGPPRASFSRVQQPLLGIPRFRHTEISPPTKR